MMARMRGWRDAGFTGLSRAARALDLGSRAMIYVGAGLLRRDGLQRAIVKAWDGFSRTDAAILSGLMPWEDAWYARVLKPRDHILLVGCGSGRDLVALLERGYRVDGLDPSEAALALARRVLAARCLSADVHRGTIEETLPPGTFDAVIFSWFTYGYIPGRAARIAVLRRAASRLNPDGRILISYVVPERPPRPFPIAVTRLIARLTRSDWEPALGDVLGPATSERGGLHYEHHFAADELEAEAKAAGLTVVLHERRDVGTAVLMV
jgi:SAM-dependent methyltransferase